MLCLETLALPPPSTERAKTPRTDEVPVPSATSTSTARTPLPAMPRECTRYLPGLFVGKGAIGSIHT